MVVKERNLKDKIEKNYKISCANPLNIEQK